MPEKNYFEIELEVFYNDLNDRFKRAGETLEIEMHQQVAQDTGTLDNSITTGPVREDVESISVEVGSFGVPYAEDVEEGDGNVYNYHRYPNGKIPEVFSRYGNKRDIIFRGNGLFWAKKSLEATKSKIISIISGKK